MAEPVIADLVPVMEAMRELNKTLESDHARIDESTFKRLFLPLLLSEQEVDLRPWAAIAGHVGRCVDVYRGDTLLYTVPPLISHEGLTSFNYGTHQSLQRRIQEAKLKIDVMPIREKEITIEALQDLMPEAHYNPQHLTMWNNVLIANGLKPLTATNTKAKNNVADTNIFDGGEDI
jgi:hypothetical protein